MTTHFVSLERVGHTFGAPGPEQESALERILDVAIRWSGRYPG